MYPGLEPKRALAHITLTELDCRMKIFATVNSYLHKMFQNKGKNKHFAEKYV